MWHHPSALRNGFEAGWPWRLLWPGAPSALRGRTTHSRQPSHPREQFHGLAVPFVRRTCRREQRPRRRPAPGPRHPRRRRRRRHGHHAPGAGTHARRLPAARRLQRDPQRHPSGRRPVGPRGVLLGRRGHRRDQHLRGQPLRAGRVRHPRADPRAVRGGRPPRPRGRRRLRRRRPPPLGARLDGPRHQAADARPHPVRRAPRRLRGERRGPDRRRRRRAAGGDHPGPAPDQGGGDRGPPRDAVGRGEPAADLLGDRGDHGHHAARLGDRCRAHRAGAARHRHDRPQLRHRPLRDERAPALSRPPLPCPAVLYAQRGPAGAHQGRRPLPAHALRTGRRPRGVRPRVRPLAGRRLLRHHAGAPAAAGGAGRRPGPAPAHRAPRAWRRLALPDRPLPAGHVLPGDRRADQRQRVEEVPRRDARRPLGRLRGDGPRPDPRGRPPARPVRGLRRPGRRRRHGRDRRTLRHRLHAADRAGLHRGPGAAGGPGEARRPRGAELGQLRGRRRPRVPVRQGDRAGPRARRRADRAHHRRGGPGPYRREEGRHRRAADRRPHRQPRHPRVGHPHRLPDLHHLHRPGGVPGRRCGHHRGDPRAEAPPPRGADHPRSVQHLLRPQPGRPGRPQLGLPGRVREGRPGLGDRARQQDPADRPAGRGAGQDRTRPGPRPACRGVRPAPAPDGAVRGRRQQVAEGGPRRGAPRAAAGGAVAAPDHRRREERPGGGPGRGADRAPGPGDRQRHATGRHEGGRRAVRLGADAAAVRAPVRRGHEDRGGLPGTAHGEVGRRGQGHHRAGHRPRRRPRHRQEPRGHHPVQQRLHRRQPRHQAAGVGDPGGGAGAPGRRHRHVGAAGEVHGDHEGEPGGAEPARPVRRLPGDPRRRRPDPRLRGAGPARDLRGRGPLRPRRVRGPAADGRSDRRQARRGRRGAAGAEAAPGGQARAARAGGGGQPRPGPVRRRHRQPGAHPAVLGQPGRQGHPARRLFRLAGRGSPLQGPVGAEAGPLHRADVRGAGGVRGPAAAARAADPAAVREPAGGRGHLRLLPVRVQGRRPGRAARGRHRAHPLHLPPAAQGAAAVPGGLLPLRGLGPDRRGGLPGGHRRQPHLGRGRRAVRRGLLPGLPGAARPVGAARRGAGRVLARQGALRAGLRGRGPGRRGGHVRAEVPRCALLAGLRGLPRPGGPGQDRRAAGAGADRREAVGGVPAAPGAVHRRDRHPPPRGEVLQRPLTGADARFTGLSPGRRAPVGRAPAGRRKLDGPAEAGRLPPPGKRRPAFVSPRKGHVGTTAAPGQHLGRGVSL
ncbi:HAD family hydrolase [Actinacidiphila cocklensis]|uniref:HAD family hydrolase n=1 Tax=Actinacidiphila cocklensis TaxID=887465 RepID=A0A9W4GVK0_9ACTN|nr:HAD family hydrolase [Actinacidiphila cocklensis]